MKGTIVEGLPRNVLMLVGEDGAADTIKPRFMKLGGDPMRLTLLQGVLTRQEGSEDVYSTITLDNIPQLEKAMKTVRPKLLIVDPFQCFLGAGVDMNRSNETRPILAELSNLAERYDCALLLIRHLKKLGDKTIYRGLGTIDIAAAARSVLLAGRNPQPPNLKDVLRTDERGQILHPKDRFALVHTKCNLGRKGPSLDYSIDDNGLTIDGISQLTADDLLNVPIKTGMNGQPDVDEWLHNFLASGPQEATAVKAAAHAQGFGRYKLQGACDRLGVIAAPSGFGGTWMYRLPDQEDEPVGQTPHADGASATGVSGDRGQVETSGSPVPTSVSDADHLG
jgi:hypothetical protein